MHESLPGTAMVNGHLTTLDKAALPLSDRGFLFGHAVFETILIAHGKIINWVDHATRLEAGCHEIWIAPPSPQELYKMAQCVVNTHMEGQESIPVKASLKLIVTGGSAWDLKLMRNSGQLPKPNIIFICRTVEDSPLLLRQKGLRLKPHFDTRPKAFLHIKSNNYLSSFLALEDALQSGFDDALFFNEEKSFTECTTANFVWFDKNHTLLSAPFENHCLPGTTFLKLKEALTKTKHTLQWQALSLDQISDAVGAAVLSSVRGFLPVSQIGQTHFDLRQTQTIFQTLDQLLTQEMMRT